MVTVRRAQREDAFACAALRLQMDLEAGESNRSGFLAEHADCVLAHFDELPTWIATTSDGAALGYVQTSIIHRAPALSRPAQPALYLGVVFVTPSARGQGLGARLLRTVDAWADEHDVAWMMLDRRPAARSCDERAGFTAPGGQYLHRDAPFVAREETR